MYLFYSLDECLFYYNYRRLSLVIAFEYLNKMFNRYLLPSHCLDTVAPFSPMHAYIYPLSSFTFSVSPSFTWIIYICFVFDSFSVRTFFIKYQVVTKIRYFLFHINLKVKKYKKINIYKK